MIHVFLENLFIYIALTFAVAIGFLVGRYFSSKPLAAKEAGEDHFWLKQRYFEGLNYLLNEKHDQAIESFITALDVNSETLETHLALGNLLRKRGEVARAIRIHQNLLARPSLTKEQQQQAQFELATDYMRSGLLDRAETLFKELVASSYTHIRTRSLENLVEIYQDEREWQKGIETIEKLCTKRIGRKPDRWRPIQAQFNCQLACVDVANRDWLGARSKAKIALSLDKQCVRANLVLAEIETALSNYRDAIRLLKKIPLQNPDYISEIFTPLSVCYEKLGKFEDLKCYLLELYETYPQEQLLVHIANTIAAQGHDAEALDFLVPRLEEYPVLRKVAQPLALDKVAGQQHFTFTQIKPLLEQLLIVQQRYQCQQCGYAGGQLHWSCPSCKSWSSMVLTNLLAVG